MIQPTTEKYHLKNVQPNPHFNTEYEGTELQDLHALALRRLFGEHKFGIFLY
jgi:hypothetical protein